MRPNVQQRPSTFTERARRDQLIQSAIQVLADSGFAATSLAAIANQLGISKGVISYHFRSKAELLHAVASDVLASAADYMTPRVASATTYREALRMYISSNLAFLAEHRMDIFALVEILGNAKATPGIPELYERSQADAVSALEQLISAGRETGEFVNLDPHVVAVSVRASIDALTSIVRGQPDLSFDVFETGLVLLYERALLVEQSAGEPR